MMRWRVEGLLLQPLGKEGSHELKADLEEKLEIQSSFELGWELTNQISNLKSPAYLERRDVGLSETSTYKSLPPS